MKHIRKWLGILCCIVFLGGCSCETNLSTTMTYEITNGDYIDLQLDVKDGYEQDGQMPFTISKEDKNLLMGRFLSLEEYEAYETFVQEEHEDMEFKRKDEVEGNPYLCYRYRKPGEEQYNFVLKIKDSNSAVLMSSDQSDEVAEAVFKAMRFEKK